MTDVPWRCYRVVRKAGVLRAIEEAIGRSGGEILERPSPDHAPFKYVVRTLGGARLTLLCYAFLANKYRQRNRPADEHRFQIKYGSEFHEYHEVYFDPSRAVVTLMFGVHLEEEVFIAIDPAMNNPTWFSRSVEVKTGAIRRAQELGWFGVERERSEARRKQGKPLGNNQTESVILFRPENFLRFVELERLASGLDTGERLLLADRLPASTEVQPARHPLLDQLQLSETELLDVIDRAFRLKTAVRGGVAELHLERYLKSVPAVTAVHALDEDGAPDFRVETAHGDYSVECKNVLRRPVRNTPKVDFQRTRASKNDPCSRYYRAQDFDVLAACLHPITEDWEFRFCTTAMLKPHRTCEGRLSQHVLVDGDLWTPDVSSVLR